MLNPRCSGLIHMSLLIVSSTVITTMSVCLRNVHLWNGRRVEGNHFLVEHCDAFGSFDNNLNECSSCCEKRIINSTSDVEGFIADCPQHSLLVSKCRMFPKNPEKPSSGFLRLCETIAARARISYNLKLS